MGDTVNEGPMEHSPPTKEMAGEEIDGYFPPLPSLLKQGLQWLFLLIYREKYVSIWAKDFGIGNSSCQ